MIFNRPKPRPDATAEHAKGGPADGADGAGPTSPTAIAAALRLSPEALRPRVDPASLGIASTADLDPSSGLIGQDRALKAVELAASIAHRDFNLFVMGPAASGKRTAVRDFLSRAAAEKSVPSSWVYVNNFVDANRPHALALPPGRCQALADGMIAVIDELRTAIPAIFESDDYQSRRRAIAEAFRERQEQAFEALTEKARGQGIAVLRTPTGIGMAPMSDGKVIKPEVFQTLSDEIRSEIEKKIEALQSELGDIVQQVPKQQKERRNRLQTLNEEVAEVAVHQAMDEIQVAFADLPEVDAYLKAARDDLIRNVGLFLGDGEEENAIVAQTVETARDDRFRRYRVNVVVSHGDGASGAPIVEELNLGHGHLIGRLEYLARMGAMLTDFLLIKPGALHRANGGYLLIDARKLLTAPFAYESLKRALRRREIRIEAPNEGLTAVSVQSLDPDPIPLDVKVVLFGDRQVYYALNALDPDFAGLFKIQADFDETIARTEENSRDYARLIASVVQHHEIRHVDASGIARMIERGARLADDNEKLSLEVGKLADLLREADHYAAMAGRTVITADDIDTTVAAQEHRADRARERALEGISREVVLIDTAGEKTGQINGLSVLSLPNLAFGKPTRITARVRPGAGRVTDIEREVELGGPLHSKGVMILWGYLAGQFAQDVPLSIAASLVFEQSYGGVDGDSASSTELYALLSALAEVPIRQSLAVTGSVNQWGEVQAIGGVNEKIEGFFDVCAARGLDGSHGVLIPKANAMHVMLREDVVAAVRDGQFHVYAVETVAEGIALLTGQEAGVRGADGAYPAGSVFARVEDKLRAYADMRARFARGGAGETDPGADPGALS